MLKPEEVRADLDNICRRNNAVWLDYDSIHTQDENHDMEEYVNAYKFLGLSKVQMLTCGRLCLKYGGGLEIAYGTEAKIGGNTSYNKISGKSLLTVPGFNMIGEQHTVYHECGHLLQYNLKFFQDDGLDKNYQNYLREVHANAFANAVFFIKAPDILSYKKSRAWLAAKNIKGFFFDEEYNLGSFGRYLSKYDYASLPIEKALLKDIHHQGRKAFLERYTDDKGDIKFSELARYCKSIVDSYAYSQDYYLQIRDNPAVFKAQKIYRRKKAYRFLGKVFDKYTAWELKQKKLRHEAVDEERAAAVSKVFDPLPEKDNEAIYLNRLASIDIAQTIISQRYQRHFDLYEIVNENTEYKKDMENIRQKSPEHYQQIMHFCSIIKDNYSEYCHNPRFAKLFDKLNNPFGGREDFWQLREQKRRQLEMQSQYGKPDYMDMARQRQSIGTRC